MSSTDLGDFRAQFLEAAETKLNAVDVAAADSNALIVNAALLRAYSSVDDFKQLSVDSLAALDVYSGAQLEAALQNIDFAADFWRVIHDAAAMTAVIASSTAMTAVAASSTAMTAVIASSTAMTAVAASSTAMTAVIASSTAMTAVAASSTAMTAVAASSTAMTAVAASSTAMTAVIASSTAMTAVAASSTAMTAVAASSTAMTALVSAGTTFNWTGLGTWNNGGSEQVIISGRGLLVGSTMVDAGSIAYVDTVSKGYTPTVPQVFETSLGFAAYNGLVSLSYLML